MAETAGSGRSEGDRSVPFEFKGDTYEWLGIWAVNLFLTIITFGIYSAWAKVRMRKYFYQNTYVAGRNFDYHATGLQILIGRIIVIVGFIIYNILAANPVTGIFAVIALLVILPWLLVRALRFNARKSSWSNVRFDFDGGYWRALAVWVIYPTLTFFTAYLAWPFADRAQRRFSVGKHRLGAAKFDFDARIGPFYKAFFATVAWLVLWLVIFALFMAAPFYDFVSAIEQNREPDPASALMVIVAIYGFIFLAVIPAGAIYRAFIRNILFNGAVLDGKHRFVSDMKPMTFAWILLSNAVLIIISMGLMLPWARIREARYSAAHTRLYPGGSLDEFVGDLETRTTAMGDAFTDLDGFDVGLPL